MHAWPVKSARLSRPAAWFFATALAFALLLAQTLGLMHGVVHGAGQHAETPSPYSVTHLHDDDDWLTSLFSSHDGAPDCRLYDQASLGSAAPAVAFIVPPVVLPSLVVAIFQGEALARWAALFDARGPP